MLLIRPQTLRELRSAPLQPTIGAEIYGVDISRPLSIAQRDAIKAAILDYKVVFFRDQTLDKQSHAAFAREFGPLYEYPSTTSDTNIVPIHKISAVESKKVNRGIQPDFIKDGDIIIPTQAGASYRRGARYCAPSTCRLSAETRSGSMQT